VLSGPFTTALFVELSDAVVKVELIDTGLAIRTDENAARTVRVRTAG